jgi:hypothetical protein
VTEEDTKGFRFWDGFVGSRARSWARSKQKNNKGRKKNNFTGDKVISFFNFFPLHLIKN